MWQHFESVCHPSGEQGKVDHRRLLLQCALLQFVGYINESIGLTLEGVVDKGPRTIEVIHSYPSPPNGWYQELLMVMTFYPMFWTWLDILVRF